MNGARQGRNSLVGSKLTAGQKKAQYQRFEHLKIPG